MLNCTSFLVMLCASDCKKNVWKLRNENNLSESIQICWIYLKMHPNDPGLWLAQGLNYMNTSRLVIAISCFNRIIINSNDLIELNLAYYFIGFSILKYNEYRSSIPYIRKSLSLGFDLTTDVYLWLGEGYMRSGRYKNAINSLVKGISLGGIADQTRLYSFLFYSIERSIDKSKVSSNSDGLASLIGKVKDYFNVDDIICLGDSHVNIFELAPELRVYQTGSPTAYNLGNEFSTTGALNIIRSILDKENPSSTAVLMTYAEIDIRNHIYKQMILNNIHINEACNLVVNKYFEVIDEIAKRGFKVIINGPFGSGLGVPSHGVLKVRNKIASIIGEKLREKTQSIDGLYSSLLPIVLAKDGSSEKSFFGEVDDNHLNKTREIVFAFFADLCQQIYRLSTACHNLSMIQAVREMSSKSTYIASLKDFSSHKYFTYGQLLKQEFARHRFEQLTIKLPSNHDIISFQIRFTNRKNDVNKYQIKMLDQSYKVISTQDICYDYKSSTINWKKEQAQSPQWISFIELSCKKGDLHILKIEEVSIVVKYLEYN